MKRIIFVDDDKLNIGQFASRFHDAKAYNVEIVSRLECLDQVLQKGECDFAFVDLMMDPGEVDVPTGFSPEQVGLLVAAMIKSKYPRAFVMILTGSYSVDLEYIASLAYVDRAAHKRNITPADVESLVSGVGQGDEVQRGRPQTMFIGSSVEGLAIAEALQSNLDYALESTIWSQGVFGLSDGTLEVLVRASENFDFATLVLTPDDLVRKRGKKTWQARDNVLFELGLFMGKLGRHRTFIVHERGVQIDLPSDLAGVTPATFSRRTDGNLRSALGPVSTQIKLAVGGQE